MPWLCTGNGMPQPSRCQAPLERGKVLDGVSLMVTDHVGSVYTASHLKMAHNQCVAAALCKLC